jgi:hypothetical protein
VVQHPDLRSTRAAEVAHGITPAGRSSSNQVGSPENSTPGDPLPGQLAARTVAAKGAARSR